MNGDFIFRSVFITRERTYLMNTLNHSNNLSISTSRIWGEGSTEKNAIISWSRDAEALYRPRGTNKFARVFSGNSLKKKKKHLCRFDLREIRWLNTCQQVDPELSKRTRFTNRSVSDIPTLWRPPYVRRKYLFV